MKIKQEVEAEFFGEDQNWGHVETTVSYHAVDSFLLFDFLQHLGSFVDCFLVKCSSMMRVGEEFCLTRMFWVFFFIILVFRPL